jgi:hypothetical protein
MTIAVWMLIAWFPVFTLYSYYRLNRNRYYIVKFREVGLLSDYEYEYFIAAYTGWLGAFRWLPGSVEFPRLHEDPAFRRFWLRSGYTAFALIVAGGFLLYMAGSSDHAGHRLPVRPLYQ